MLPSSTASTRSPPHPFTSHHTRYPHELAHWRSIPRSIQKHDSAHMNESDVLFFVRTARRQSIHSIASSAWLLYDLLTTFDQEVEFVWRSANTLPKYLYFVSRYGGLFGQFIYATGRLPIFCQGDYMSSVAVLSCMILAIEMSLMLRIDALYSKSRRIRLVLSIGFMAEVVCAVAMNTALYHRAFRDLKQFPPNWPIKGCFVPINRLLFKLGWVPILSFETLLFSLNAVKCISYGPLDHAPLIYRLFRDGTAYFAM
ncbi:hypothetical protein C8Q78DRAFT_30147 [Trametes maxima]|nr:hypothetical protein C8Q78DRAFT_30147 [Trametes maxima]